MDTASPVIDAPPRLSPHFTLAEFIATQHRRVDNTLPDDLLPNARETCAMLERIRAFLSEKCGRTVPVVLSSGYRSPALNRAVGGSRTSDHMKALAADFNARRFGSPHQVAAVLAPVVDDLGIGQIIQEFATLDGRGWVHVSTRTPAKAANRIVTYDRHAGRTRVRAGIHRPTA